MSKPQNLLFPVLWAGLSVLTGAQNATTPEAPPQPTPAGNPAQFQWGDFDADGLQDAAAITASGRLTLLHNLGDGSFEDVTRSYELGTVRGARFALWEDFDQDGLVDLFVGTASGPSQLFQNVGAFFVDVAPSNGLSAPGFDESAHWTDYDHDGRLDLHLVQRGAHTLYHARADGSFEAVALPFVASEAVLNTTIVPQVAGATLPENVPEEGPTTSRPETLIGISGNGRAGTGGSTRGPGGGSTAASPSVRAVGPLCMETIADDAGGACLMASSTPTLGKLFPLSEDLFVSAANGRVGIGTTTPAYELHVDGKIVSGMGNTSTGNQAAIGGGEFNSADGVASVVGGGSGNSANYNFVAILGGVDNTANAPASSIGGGAGNTTEGFYDTIGGGRLNRTDGDFAGFATVSGGSGNEADGPSCTVSGGEDNEANGQGSVVVGGRRNLASGYYAAVLGGVDNISFDYSVALGRRAHAPHGGSFVFGDSTDTPSKTTSNSDQFNVYADGGVRMFAEGVSDPSMVIDPDGSTGVGVATPQAALHVQNGVTGATPNSNADLVVEGTEGLATWINVLGEENEEVGILLGNPSSSSDGALIWQDFFDHLQLRAAGTTHMVVEGNGNVGIGTLSPQRRLHIVEDSFWPVRIEGNASPGVQFDNTTTSSSFAIYHDANDNLNVRDSTSGVTRMVVRGSDGNVGIGTETPSQALHVVGNICATGTITACSDERYKDSVEDLEGALETVRKLRGVSYRWRTEEFPDRGFSEERQLGFLAQEVLAEVPEVVARGSDGYYAVDYGRLTPVLVEAVKELSDQNAQMRTTNESLEERLVRLEAMEAELDSLKETLASLVGSR